MEGWHNIIIFIEPKKVSAFSIVHILITNALLNKLCCCYYRLLSTVCCVYVMQMKGCSFKTIDPCQLFTPQRTDLLHLPYIFITFLRMSKCLKFYVALSFLLLFAFVACSQSIYKTPSGKKYHLGSCNMVRNVSEKITPERALELQLEPCKICRPDINHLRLSTENKSVGQSVSVQCKGFTRKGDRCKHYTHIANGYCFQHQPG